MCFTRPTSVRKDNLCVVVLQVDCLVRSAVMYRHRIQFVEKPMKKIVFGLSAIILALSLVQSARSIEPKVRESLIVSTDWLAKHLNDDLPDSIEDLAVPLRRLRDSQGPGDVRNLSVMPTN